jgi:hypothetical protein
LRSLPKSLELRAPQDVGCGVEYFAFVSFLDVRQLPRSASVELTEAEIQEIGPFRGKPFVCFASDMIGDAQKYITNRVISVVVIYVVVADGVYVLSLLSRLILFENFDYTSKTSFSTSKLLSPKEML